MSVNQEEEKNQVNSTLIDENEMVVNPWKVSGTVDYMKLISHFGTNAIDGKIIERWEQVTGMRAHTWLRRGLFFSHQDLEKILDERQAGRNVYLYTGRGPSSESMHLGHLVPFIFTKYLQDALDAIVIIQMSDDEKFFFKGGKIDEYLRLSYENAKDIIACGFNPNKTFIFSNLQSMAGDLYYNNAIIMQTITGNQIKGIYGLGLDNNIGQLVWPCFQSGPAFSTSFRDILGDKPIYCLVPMAIDQAPYFRMARDVHKKLKCPKPAVIHSRFLPGLQGPKMNSTSNNVENITLFLNINRTNIIKMIKRHAYSGGRETIEEHRDKGGDIRADVCYQYLCYFMDSDCELKNIAQQYSSGQLLTSELKNITANIIADVIEKHQQMKDLVTDTVLKQFFNRNRQFDLSDKKPNPDLNNPYQDYEKYGINFDLTFGYRPKCETQNDQQ